MTQVQFLTFNLNHKRDISECRFTRQRVVYVVERVKRLETDLTCTSLYGAESVINAAERINNGP